MKIRAFTLIELLVVIVIIGILSGIGISQFKGYQQKAENAQRVTVVSNYLNALKRMNASGESFPVTTGLATNSTYTWLTCLLKTDTGFCWSDSIAIELVQSVKDQFNKHLQGADELIETKSGSQRQGLIYMYPIRNTSSYTTPASAAGFNNLNKTMRMDWIMDGINYPCENFPGGVTHIAEYSGDRTYCVAYMEDINN